MKKIILALVVLVFAAPAWADVVITAAQVGDTNEVVISFDATTETNLVRAFSLDIQLDDDAKIIEVVPAMVGVCTETEQGYGIFPGTILITGNVVTYDGTPVGEVADSLDTLPGLDSNGVTIEMGSLYAPTSPGSPNAPAKSGVLLSLYVSRPTAPDLQTCLTISGNVARAGSSGVVMEDPDEVVTVSATGCCVDFPPLECYWGQPDYAEWEAVGKPLSWCYKRQCHGDADNADEQAGKIRVWVGLNDLKILIDGWRKQPYVDPATHPWIAADFNHADEQAGKVRVRVGLDDLAIMVANWRQEVVADDCLDLP